MNARQRCRHTLRGGRPAAVSIIALFLLVAPCSPSPSLPGGITPQCGSLDGMVQIPRARTSSLGAEEGFRRNAYVRASRCIVCPSQGERAGRTFAGDAEQPVPRDGMRLHLRAGSGRREPPTVSGHVRTILGSLHQRGGEGGEGTEEMRTGLENLDQVEEDLNQTKAPSNTEGGCPHGRHSDNPDEQHCMECEVMAFLQRAANLLQQAGGRIESTIFAEQWTQLYPEDPLTAEQVATAVAGILKESGYFHVEETSDPAVKLFELIEQADDGAGIGDCPQTICLPFELAPPEQDDFLDAARDWLATTGVGRHPAVGSGRMTHEELAELISKAPEKGGKPRQRHDEVQYTGKWGEQLVGYWTLGACDGSNGCLHKKKNIGMQHHWTCCGSTDMMSVFCADEGEGDEESKAPIPELP